GVCLVSGGAAPGAPGLDALVFQGLLAGRGAAFAVLLLVVNHGDVFRFDVVGDEVAGGGALQAVEADGAEDQFIAARSDVRAGGRRGNHQDAFVFVDVRSRLGRTEIGRAHA